MPQETHRLVQRPWFWLYPLVVGVAEGVDTLRNGISESSSPWLDLLAYFIVLGPLGYRVHADSAGVSIRLLGFARLFQLIFPAAWGRFSFQAADVLAVRMAERSGIGRYVAWPVLGFSSKDKHRMDFGSRWALCVERPGFGLLTIGLRAEGDVRELVLSWAGDSRLEVAAINA